MSQLEVDKIVPQSGTTLTIGDSGDTITVASGATLTGDLNASNLTSGTVPDARITGAYTGITGLTINTDATGITVRDASEAEDRLEVGVTGSSSAFLKTSISSGSLELEAGNIFLKNTSGTNLFRAYGSSSTGDIAFYEDTGTTPKFYWDASTERLGIGTTSSVGKFHIQSSDQNHIYLNGTSGDAYGLWVTPTGTNFNLGTWSGRETIKIDGDGNTIQFETDSSERMRIDSSGNVLINTTDASTLTAGIKLRASDNAIAAVVTSNPSGYFGRLSTDGEIVKFRRDSTTVGGIGSRSGTSNIYIESASSGRLRANGVDVAGWNSSTGTFFSATDNGNDLGTNVNRWKDLYLGGGLYVGGIGTANKLDDYEEGTFTPSFSSGNGFGSLSYVFQRGTYTKIGRIVNIRIQIELGSGVTKNGNRIIMDGLPFTSSSALPGTGLNWSYVNSKVIGSTTTNIPTLWVTSNNNSIQWYKTDGSDFTGNDTSGSTTNMDIYINGTYQTDA